MTERQRRMEEPEKAGKPDFTRKEKQDYVEQVEEFEGPDRRETRGSPPEPPKEPGVARS